MPARSYLETYRVKIAYSAPRLRLKRRGRWRAHGHDAHPWRGGDGQHFISLDRVIRSFYNLSRLAIEIQGVLQRSVFQEGDQFMAERRSTGGVVHTRLLTTNLQRSVLQAATSNSQQFFAYNAYGHQSTQSGLFSLLGFNGERADPVTGHYVLGNGYRTFNPVLMRFKARTV